MADSPIFVIDSSPVVASCQFSVGRRAVADIVLPEARVHIRPAVYKEVVTRGGARSDALIAAELITTGPIRVADATAVGEALEDLQHYHLGQGDTEVLTLTARLATARYWSQMTFWR